MGTRPFKNGEAHEYLDTARGLSDADKRHIEHLIAQDDAKWSQVMTGQYAGTVERLSGDLDSVLRICEEGSGTVDDILEDLRDGSITAREAAAQLGAARRDLNRLRKVTHEAGSTEERAWSEVNVSPADFQEALMRRAPALFRGGRGLVNLPTYDD